MQHGIFKISPPPLPKVGMRMIKTALAVFLALLLEPILLNSNGFYGGIATIICMKKTWKDSYVAGRDRIVATLIGGFSGWIFLELTKFFGLQIENAISPQEFLRSFLLAATVLLVIYLTLYIEQSSTTVLSCVVFLSIAVNHANDVSALAFATQRVLATSLGIFIAVFVDWLLPNKNVDINLDDKNEIRDINCDVSSDNK